MKTFLNFFLIFLKDVFDFSNYSKDSEFFNEANKMVIVDELVGLKSKMYSVKKLMVNNQILLNEFKDVLFNKKVIKHKMKRIQAKKHKIGTYEIDKVSSSWFDDERFVLDDGVHTLAYFHKDSVASCRDIKKDHNKEDCDKEDPQWLKMYWGNKNVSWW